MSISPKIWGASGWIFLDSIIETYPVYPTSEEKEKYKNFFLLVGKVLPCKKCRLNYITHLEAYPLNEYTLENNINMQKWYINVRNHLNESLNRPKINIKKIRNELYNNLYVTNSGGLNYINFKIHKKIIIIIIIIAIIMLYIKYIKRIK